MELQLSMTEIPFLNYRGGGISYPQNKFSFNRKCTVIKYSALGMMFHINSSLYVCGDIHATVLF